MRQGTEHSGIKGTYNISFHHSSARTSHILPASLQGTGNIVPACSQRGEAREKGSSLQRARMTACPPLVLPGWRASPKSSETIRGSRYDSFRWSIHSSFFHRRRQTHMLLTSFVLFNFGQYPPVCECRQRHRVMVSTEKLTEGVLLSKSLDAGLPYEID